MFRANIFMAPLLVVLIHITALANKPNILIITVDDMSCDSVGVYGSELADTTPHMDAFARTAIRFEHAHVQVGNCMPSRNVMWSGRYPHNNGVEGFYQVETAKYPTLCTLAQDAGYFTAIRHKVGHSTPYAPYRWDLVLDVLPDGRKAHIKDAASYGESLRIAIDAAERRSKPFCAVINISDPHKPFYSQVKSGKDPHVPSKIFEPNEVPVPRFLPDDPVVKQEVALYYSSVRRADDAVGEIFSALAESGKSDDTFVMFLSDHGMPLPFAKTQLYHHSTRTPLMIRWPGVTTAGEHDTRHMVSAVDFLPTLMDVIGEQTPPDVDGQSFVGALRGQDLSGRDFVAKEYNENSGAKRNPMRAIETKEYLYVFNPWSDGNLQMATATNGTESFKRMKELAKSNPDVAARVELMVHRVPEELYHVATDRDCLENLIDAPEHAQAADELRAILKRHLHVTRDPISEVFANRESAEYRVAYMRRVQKEADARRAAKRKVQKQKSASRSTRPKRLKAITRWRAEIEEKQLTVELNFKLPAELGTQKLVVTLKDSDKKRVERKELKIEGAGQVQVLFQCSAEADVLDFHLAAFVGNAFETNLQYLTSPVRKLAE